ncbi:MAG: macro domain-containing protein, partial [Oscillospiraceae bacterium]|nr:macro domain-containing protein [Oscillospiraceae bacterium]
MLKKGGLNVPLKIIRNDITKVTADAIVNTANPRPVIGDGTDRAIHEAAGPELLRARQAVGDIPVGSSAETPAFNLPAKYVLHTVCPPWAGGTQSEENLLRQAYDRALCLSEKLGCASVAFPLMGAGSYAFPKDKALSAAVGAITDFLLTHDMTVYLVLFNGEAFDLASSLFDDLKSYIDDNYVEAREKAGHFKNRGALRRSEAMAF